MRRAIANMIQGAVSVLRFAVQRFYAWMLPKGMVGFIEPWAVMSYRAEWANIDAG